MDINFSSIGIPSFKAQQMFSLSVKAEEDFIINFSLQKESRISPLVNTKLSEPFPCLWPRLPTRADTGPHQGLRLFPSLSLSKKALTSESFFPQT